MKMFKTIKAKIFAVLTFAVIIVVLNAGANQYTNRLKNINNDLTRKSQVIKVLVQENLMMEAQYTNKRDTEILEKISEVDARFNEQLYTMKSRAGKGETKALVNELESAYGKHQDIFKQISATLTSLDTAQNDLTEVSATALAELVKLTEGIEEKSLSILMLGQEPPAGFNTLTGLIKDITITFNRNAQNLQSLFVLSDREDYDKHTGELKNKLAQDISNIDTNIGAEMQDYAPQWEVIKPLFQQTQDLEDNVVSAWSESRRLAKELETAVAEVMQVAESMSSITEKQAARYDRLGLRISQIVLIGGMLIFLAVGGLLANAIVKPIKNVVDGLKDVAEGEGDLTKRLKIKGEDEVGDLANWFNVFIERIQRIIAEVAQNAGQLTLSAKTLSNISNQMATGAEQTSTKAGTVASAGDDMSNNMIAVAASMEEASTNMNMVSAATEEMTTTISEIASNTEKARSTTNNAVEQAAMASHQVLELGEAAKKIEQVIETITEISEQVNLLALNATIEAARAGEAGKGFAVVANEIKELAKETASATGQIRNNVEAIQTSTGGTVEEINAITEVVNSVNDIVSTIAAAIEEQSVTTRDISENVSHASQGISEVNTNVTQSSTAAGEIAVEIADVTMAAGQMSDSSAQVNQSANELSGLAQTLNDMVALFKV